MTKFVFFTTRLLYENVLVFVQAVETKAKMDMCLCKYNMDLKVSYIKELHRIY